MNAYIHRHARKYGLAFSLYGASLETIKAYCAFRARYIRFRTYKLGYDSRFN